MLLSLILPLSLSLSPAAAKVYTGFNYGAFWSHPSNVKRYTDFHHGFQLAQNLSNTPVPFDSARLFTCITTGTKDSPTEAFQAAIDTGTHLLLGMWVSPSAPGESNTAQIANEVSALGKAFAMHGTKLADLVIGLSIGSEDIYRFSSQQTGLSTEDLIRTIEIIRDMIATSPFAGYMKDKPIGHADTAPHSVVSGTDFAGLNAYPFWEGTHIDHAAASFEAALEATKQKAGNTPVWISEMGWPVNGTQRGGAVASAENYQRFWSEVGCSVFGRYTSFWFELLQDAEVGQLDWGLLDTETYRPRIEVLGCGVKAGSASLTVGGSSTAALVGIAPTTLETVKVAASGSAIVVPSSAVASGNSTLSTNSDVITLYLTTTTTSILPPPSFSPSPTPPRAFPSIDPSNSSNFSTGTNNPLICIAMMDLIGDGTYIPVATYATDIISCRPPPRFTGRPFRMVEGPVTTAGLVASASAGLATGSVGSRNTNTNTTATMTVR